MFSVIRIGNHVHVKSSGVGDTCSELPDPQAMQNLLMPNPQYWQGRQMPLGWAQLDLMDVEIIWSGLSFEPAFTFITGKLENIIIRLKTMVKKPNEAVKLVLACLITN